MFGWVLATATAIGLLWLGLGSSKASSTTPTDPPKPDEPPPVTELRIREVTTDTPTPWQFAEKYGGAGIKWKEIPSVNPSIKSETYVVWQDNSGFWHRTDPPGYVPPDPSAPGGVRPSQSVTGLTPWYYGMKVFLPADWPG